MIKEIPPKEIRHNKNLTYFERLLYGEIAAIIHGGGEASCYASDKYFAEMFGVCVSTVNHAINKLCAEKLLEKKRNYTKNTRYLSFFCLQNSTRPLAKNTKRTCKKSQSYINDELQEGNFEKDMFTPPTLDEVAGYCNERKNKIEPQKFIDFYQSKGWRVGNQKMKDWRASVRLWERNEKKSAPRGDPPSSGNPFRELLGQIKGGTNGINA